MDNARPKVIDIEKHSQVVKVVVLAQFGERAGVLEPTLSDARLAFPRAKVVLFSDRKAPVPPGVDEYRYVPPIKELGGKDHPRYGYRMNDYYKIKGLLTTDDGSRPGVAVALDADMEIAFFSAFRTIGFLAHRFGLVLPSNPRGTAVRDTLTGADSDKKVDNPYYYGPAVNMTPIAFDWGNERAEQLLNTYLDEMLSRPVRGPLAMWRAICKTGFMPCLLPPQWCVCAENVGIGGEICLHVGHGKVRAYYSGEK